MQELLIAAAIFGAGYLLNIFYITVFYHRGLAHGSVTLSPLVAKWIALTGNWFTGIDPKAWACMHRLHHQHSDTKADPHSPIHQGVFGLLMGQLRSYKRVLKRLIAGDPKFTRVVEDIPFEVHYLNRSRLWFLPYALHASLAVVIAFVSASPLFGLAYYGGIMSHPIQGWMVNALAHRFGYQTFNTGDNSRNNSLVALLVFGEGYQNNHHAHPERAKFSILPSEVDFGYALCRLGQATGLLQIATPKDDSTVLSKALPSLERLC